MLTLVGVASVAGSGIEIVGSEGHHLKHRIGTWHFIQRDEEPTLEVSTIVAHFHTVDDQFVNFIILDSNFLNPGSRVPEGIRSQLLGPRSGVVGGDIIHEVEKNSTARSIGNDCFNVDSTIDISSLVLLGWSTTNFH